MELQDLLTLRKSELIHAPVEKQEEIRKDIVRLREAIVTEKELRGNTERGKRALASADPEQWKFEAERRLAEPEAKSRVLDISKMSEEEKEQLRQAWRDGKCRIVGNVVQVDIEESEEREYSPVTLPTARGTVDPGETFHAPATAPTVDVGFNPEIPKGWQAQGEPPEKVVVGSSTGKYPQPLGENDNPPQHPSRIEAARAHLIKGSRFPKA
jgi:hypothetical protein